MQLMNIKSEKQVLLWKNRTGRSGVLDKKRWGRPRKFSGPEQRSAVRLITHSKFGSTRHASMKMAKSGTKMCSRTVGRIAKRRGSHSRHAPFPAVARVRPSKVFLSAQNKIDRFQWAKQHRNWSVDDWKSVLFSDETPKEGLQVSRYQWVGQGQQPKPKQKMQAPPKIQAFAAITWWGKTKICLIPHGERLSGEKYRNLLKDTTNGPSLIAQAKRLFKGRGEWRWQQDNAPAHSAASTKRFFEEEKIQLLPFPASSPDLNIAENVWKYLDDCLQRRPLITNQTTLWQEVQRAWNTLQTKRIRNLYKSMPARVQAVIKAKGGNTKY